MWKRHCSCHFPLPICLPGEDHHLHHACPPFPCTMPVVPIAFICCLYWWYCMCARNCARWGRGTPYAWGLFCCLSPLYHHACSCYGLHYIIWNRNRKGDWGTPGTPASRSCLWGGCHYGEHLPSPSPAYYYALGSGRILFVTTVLIACCCCIYMPINLPSSHCNMHLVLLLYY